MPWIDFAQTGALTAAVALAMVITLWLLSMPLRDISIIDLAFSSLILGLLLVAYLFNRPAGVIPILILVLVFIWATRMTLYLVSRNWGHGEDPRYSRLRSWVGQGWPFHWLSLRQVFLLQGAVIWMLTLPQQIAMVTGDQAEFGLVAGIGLCLWCTGFFFETIGDYQLSRFKASRSEPDQILNTGLWRYTRHPNYFGELCQWWGLFVIAAQAPWAWCGIIGPLGYSWLVINVTGQRTLEKKMAREKPQYAEYVRVTSGLIPRPPRRSNGV
jgi:steroid 5-alpha reductase family enzyme